MFFWLEATDAEFFVGLLTFLQFFLSFSASFPSMANNKTFKKVSRNQIKE